VTDVLLLLQPFLSPVHPFGHSPLSEALQSKRLTIFSILFALLWFVSAGNLPQQITSVIGGGIDEYRHVVRLLSGLRRYRDWVSAFSNLTSPVDIWPFALLWEQPVCFWAGICGARRFRVSGLTVAGTRPFWRSGIDGRCRFLPAN